MSKKVISFSFVGFLGASGFILGGCATDRKSEMAQHFVALQRDRSMVEKAPEPKTPKKDLETEVLSLLERVGNDGQAAVVEAKKEKIQVAEVAPSMADLLADAEVNGQSSQPESNSSTSVQGRKSVDQVASKSKSIGRKVASYMSGGACFSPHPALRRLQSDRMKIQSFHSDKEKYHGQVMRSYADMGGVELQSEVATPRESLQMISQRVYGTTLRWPELYVLNKDVIEHYDHVPPGAELQLPVVERNRHCSDEPDPSLNQPRRMSSE